MPKIAILMSYLRVFPTKTTRIIVYAIFVMTVAYMVASCWAFWLHCHPLAKFLNTTTPGHCVPIIPMLANSISNVTLDIVLLLASIPMLLKWEVSTRMRFLTGGVFATGSL